MSEEFARLAEAVIAGKVEEVTNLVHALLDAGTPAQSVLDTGLMPGMEVVGRRFKACEMYIPEVLRPLLSDAESSGAGKFVIGTVKGDLHDIGKNLVAMMFEGAGFQVVNLGIDLDAQVFVDAVKEHQPDILGLSALLTTTMPRMAEAIDALKEAGIRDQVKVIVGGAPVTADYAEKIGADAYGANAAMAVETGKALMAS
jgi:5-methyltetrahydrofolate--homocysteine methyltransferase